MRIGIVWLERDYLVITSLRLRVSAVAPMVQGQVKQIRDGLHIKDHQTWGNLANDQSTKELLKVQYHTGFLGDIEGGVELVHHGVCFVHSLPTSFSDSNLEPIAPKVGAAVLEAGRADPVTFLK